MLTEALEHYPNQPVFHYFRYQWIEEYLLLKPYTKQELVFGVSNEQLRHLADQDLERARTVDPEWLSMQ